MGEAVIRRRYLVSGRVQGVGYRAFVLRLAAALGLRGWVRNRCDGGVELLAEAAPEVHVALREALGQGPPWAQVSEVESRDVESGGDALVAFHLRPTV